jgi:hypothetical protein
VFDAASATDSLLSPVAITYSNASGTQFSLGTTPVTVTAADALGNVASGVFYVTVQTAPSDVTFAQRADGSKLVDVY